MTLPQQILTIAVVVLGTMTTRFLPFLLFPEGKQPPAFIRYLDFDQTLFLSVST